MPEAVHLQCAVCGSYAGKYQQHSNRDNGYGVCLDCVRWLLTERKVPPAEMKNNYGIAGINYKDPNERLRID